MPLLVNRIGIGKQRDQRLLPQDNWFGVVINRQVAAKPAPVEAPQTTGSLPTAPAAEGVANPATP